MYHGNIGDSDAQLKRDSTDPKTRVETVKFISCDLRST